MKSLFDVSGSANTAQPGWTKFRVIDRGFYTPDRTRGVKADVQAIALAHTTGPIIWNIEHWPVPAEQDKFIEIINWVREVRPDLRQGIYSLIPVRNYWGPVQHALGLRPNSYDAWLRQNAVLAEDGGLANYVDFTCPSLYTFYNSTDSPAFNLEELWHDFARLTIVEAKKYKKPVYPFIWPRFHPSAHPTMPPMRETAFVAQLETVLTHADGVCVWDDGAQKIKFDYSVEQIMREIAKRNIAGEFE